jgi:hypothetical protein
VNRRAFLTGAAACALAPALPVQSSSLADAARRQLRLIEAYEAVPTYAEWQVSFLRQIAKSYGIPYSHIIGDPLSGVVVRRETMDDQSDYGKYRGKCKEFAESLAGGDPVLTIVRGYYHCPIWGEQPHWWCKRSDGTTVDPTKGQFPSKGLGQYVEFDGTMPCSNCGKVIKEEDADVVGNYAFCSYRCHGQFVGVL